MNLRIIDAAAEKQETIWIFLDENKGFREPAEQISKNLQNNCN